MIGLLRLANRDQGLGRPRDELGRFSAHHVASSKGRGCERKYWRDSRKSQENHSEQLEEGRVGGGKGLLVPGVLGVEFISGESAAPAIWSGPQLFSSAEVKLLPRDS